MITMSKIKPMLFTLLLALGLAVGGAGYAVADDDHDRYGDPDDLDLIEIPGIHGSDTRVDADHDRYGDPGEVDLIDIDFTEERTG